MPKAILFDADGVALKKQPYFSLEIAKENNIPYEVIEPFYKNELRLCQVGAADMKEELAKYLPKWKWHGSVDEFLKRWFTTDVHPDETVLALVDLLRERGVKSYLASEQEKYRSGHIWNVANLKARFDGSFFTHDVGVLKSTPEYFQSILARLNLQPSELQFWDDDQKNVDVAKSIGIDARFYTNFDELKQATAQL